MKCKDKYESERFVLSHTCDATIMGGYIRDMILERPWKDIDLFFCVTPDDIESCSKGYHFSLVWYKDGVDTITSWKAVSKAGYESDFCVMQCAELPGVQLVLYTKGYDSLNTQYGMAVNYMVQHFPCTLSKVAMNMEVSPQRRWFYMSAAFEWAVRNQALEFSVGCPQEYRDRMASYFPDFTIQPDSPFF